MISTTADMKKSAQKIINNDPFCPVRLTPIRNRDSITDKVMVELQKPDSDEWEDIPGVGAVHGGNYLLVTNLEARRMAEEVITRTGMNFTHIPSFSDGQSKGIAWNGKHYIERWYTPDVKIETSTGSKVMLGMEAHNSYDGHCNVGVAFFAMHCACANQFYSRHLFGNPFDFSHIGEADGRQKDISIALNELMGNAERFAKIAPTIDILVHTRMKTFGEFLDLRKKMTNDTGLDFKDRAILDELSGSGVTSSIGIDVGGAYGEPDSFWALANAFTAISTHAVGGLRGRDHSTRSVDWLIEEVRERNDLPRRPSRDA